LFLERIHFSTGKGFVPTIAIDTIFRYGWNGYYDLFAVTDAVFINPAALTLNEGYSFTIGEVSAAAGVSAGKVPSQSSTLSSSDFSSFYGNTLFSDASAKSGMAFPNFGFGAYSSNYIHLRFDDPVFPTFNFDFVSDYGYIDRGCIFRLVLKHRLESQVDT
jgi:hypothetical protein